MMGQTIGTLHMMLELFHETCLSRGMRGWTFIEFGLPEQKLKYMAFTGSSGGRLTADDLMRRAYPPHRFPSLYL